MPQVQHIALLKFQPEVSEAEIALVLQKIEGLKQLIPGIDYCKAGAYSSSEGLNKGFTHSFLITFESVEARDHYLPHPAHETVKNALIAIIEDVVVFDFVAG